MSAKWFDKLTIPSIVEGKSVIISTIILITSICGIAVAATPAEIEQAIEDGIAWLAAQQDPCYGYWQDDSHRAAPTGLALTVLQERAFVLGYSPFDPCYPYNENVEKGFAYLFSQTNIINTPNQPAGNPDTDGDGNGVFVYVSVAGGVYFTYATGIAMMAIAVSQDPNREVNSPGSPVHGWTYKEVLVDMVDYMSFGQIDRSYGQGGWRYSHYDNSGAMADNSNSGYAVLGLAYAEALAYGFNCTVPQFVKDELSIWIDYIQNDADGDAQDGGSGYSSPDGSVNMLKTGNIVLQMVFHGDEPDTQRLKDALDYLGRSWNNPTQNPGWGNPYDPHCQATFCIMRGLVYAGFSEIVVGGSPRDWCADFNDALVNAQDPCGYWPNDPYGGTILATEWALLTLERSAPIRIPTLEKDDSIGDGNYVEQGDEIAYTICYSYSDEPFLSDIYDVNIIDYLPAEVDFNDASAGGVYDSNSHTVRWPIGTISPGDVNCFTLTVEVKCLQPGSTIENSCEMKSGNQPLNTSHEYTPAFSWYPTLTKEDVGDGNCVGPGDYVNYSICYDANGYSDTNVEITDVLPPGTEFDSATGNYEHIAGTVTWNIGTLGPNDTNYVTLTVEVKCPQPGGTITNSCELNGDCISPIYAEENTPVCTNYPTLTMVDVNDGNCVGPGDYVTYNICYAANDYGDTNVMITDTLPNEVNYISSDPFGSYNPINHIVEWSIDFPPDACDCIELVVQVNARARPGGIITNTCELSGDCINLNTEEHTGVCCWNGPVVYVDVNAKDYNNGTSWEDAYNYLQDALLTAQNCECNEVWVAEGVYIPSEPTDPCDQRTATFELINCVAIYGGFPSGGGAWEERNPVLYETILSGDLQGNDSQVSNPQDMLDDPSRAENSYHVVTGSGVNNTAVLNGFVITGGNANYNDPYDVGGGMYNNDGSPTVRNCQFKCNAARGGEGAYGVVWGGGGMYNRGITTISNCSFVNNWSMYGGGIFNVTDMNVVNCTFVGNGADFGGGIHSKANINVTNCILWDNQGGQISGSTYYYYLSVTYSDIQGGWPGVGNIDEDPMLHSDGLHLTLCSPCIDAGKNTPPGGLEPNDIDGEDRIMNGRCASEATVDMGADEYYVDDCNIFLCAYCPTPVTNYLAYFYIDKLELSWRAGSKAADINGHRIYLETDYSEVLNATTDTPRVYRGTTTDPCYPLIRLLEDRDGNSLPDYNLIPNTVYYWRIDEVNDTNICTGNIWNFSMGEYVIVDDFSYYTSSDMNAVWTAPVTNYCFPECASNPGGTIALDAGRMRFSYDNRGTIACPWSEAKADNNGVGVDWTAGGLIDPNAISIAFNGNASNSTNPDYDRMYIAIEDKAGHVGNLAYHPDPNAQAKTCWQKWHIPLADLNDPNVDLTDINALYIGTGPRCSWGPPPYTYGGTGVVTIDNIRLYMRPWPCVSGLAADFTVDCVVNIYDMKVMSQKWLTSDTEVDIYPECNPDGIVDFSDFAIFANDWLTEDNWPKE